MLQASLVCNNAVRLVDPRSLSLSNAAHRDYLSLANSHARPGRSCRVGASASTSGPAVEGVADVVLTREAGKNGDLARRLGDRSIKTLELPLVETGPGPDREQLEAVLRDETFDYVIVTSPESANVLIAAWQAAGQPEVRVAVVGDGTGRVLQTTGQKTLQPVFVPTKANAVHLSAELPLLHDRAHRVLYPASAKAGSDLQNGLAARGVEVVRLNTYTTRQVAALDQAALEQARHARVLSIASPSAIKAWVQLAGREGCPAVACIGSTSANAARQLGLPSVFSTEAPGMDGFVEAIEEALAYHAIPPGTS